MFEFFNFKKKEKPNLDKDTTKRIEKTSIELGRKDLIKEDKGRLSKEQAVAYQDYATSVEGSLFSEKAGEGSYVEAEVLLSRLADKNLDWLKIDWKKIDLKDLRQYEEVEERLNEAIRQIAQSTKDEGILRILGKHKNITIPLILAISILTAFNPKSSRGEEVIGEKSDKLTELRIDETADSSGKFDFKLYSPHIDIEKRKFSWKAILEPLAFAVSKEKQTNQDISFDIPYEYARLFNTGKPSSEEDYEKLNKYIEKKILEQLKSSIYAFGFDEKALREKDPNFFQDLDMEVKKITIIGVSSPEAKKRGSELSGNIDSENIDLAKLRAEDSLEKIKEVLEKLGIEYSPEEINIEGIESQFSVPELEALSKIGEREGLDIFDLIKAYNDGKITNQESKENLDGIVGSKRKVIVHLNLKDGSQKVLIIPLPLLLLGAIPFLRRRRNETPTLPPSKIEPIVYEKITEKEDVISNLYFEKSKEIYIEEILKDIMGSYEMYDQIAVEYEKYDLVEEQIVINTLTHEILIKWMDMDNKEREKYGQPPEDYFKRESQKVYAMLHAVAVRRLAIMKQEGRDMNNISEAELIRELRVIVKEEIEKVFALRK